jgi:hypothetical protein
VFCERAQMKQRGHCVRPLKVLASLTVFLPNCFPSVAAHPPPIALEEFEDLSCRTTRPAKRLMRMLGASGNPHAQSLRDHPPLSKPEAFTSSCRTALRASTRGERSFTLHYSGLEWRDSFMATQTADPSKGSRVGSPRCRSRLRQMTTVSNAS